MQHKASLDPGDSKPMVAARRRFLDSGAYRPIADRICETTAGIASGLREGRQALVLDAGCGEGYYLAALAEHASANGWRFHLAGLDISKWAVQAAAKRTQACFWAVGTNRHLPFAPGSLDVILCMFGFPVWDAFAAALAPGGRVVMADPGPDHLIEMRSIIYRDVKRAESGSNLGAAAARSGLLTAGEERITFAAQLSSQGLIADLLAMTPHGYRATAEGRQALEIQHELTVTIDVTVRQFVSTVA